MFHHGLVLRRRRHHLRLVWEAEDQCLRRHLHDLPDQTLYVLPVLQPSQLHPLRRAHFCNKLTSLLLVSLHSADQRLLHRLHHPHHRPQNVLPERRHHQHSHPARAFLPVQTLPHELFLHPRHRHLHPQWHIRGENHLQ